MLRLTGKQIYKTLMVWVNGARVSKIQAIKYVRSISNWGLRESKKICDEIQDEYFKDYETLNARGKAIIRTKGFSVIKNPWGIKPKFLYIAESKTLTPWVFNFDSLSCLEVYEYNQGDKVLLWDSGVLYDLEIKSKNDLILKIAEIKGDIEL